MTVRPPRDVPARSLGGLAARLAAQWWPQVAALAVACGIVTATIIGALGVGESVQQGLASLAVERLGRIESALLGEEMFTDAFVARAVAAVEPPATAVPAIVLDVSLASGSDRRSTRATLLACDAPWALGFAEPETAARPSLAGETAILNLPLAQAVDAEPGDAVVLRIPRRSGVPADSPLGRRDAGSDGRRLRVATVLPDAGLGRFSLRPVQETGPLVITSLATARAILGRGDVANAILLVGSGPQPARFTDFLTRVRPAPADYGLALAADPADGPSLRLTSRRLILPPDVDRAAAAVLAPLGGRRSLAFLAVSLATETAASDTAPTQAAVPYSTVLGIDATALPVGDLVDDTGAVLPLPGLDEMIVNRWLADDLAAQGRPVAVGDRIEVRTFEPETVHGAVEETTASFRISGIAEMKSAAVARELVPEVEGVTDEDSIADWDPPFPFDAARVRSTPPHDEDDRYWKLYRATPKAFVSLAAAERLAGSRFGRSTAWHVPKRDDNDPRSLADRLAAALQPEQLGIRVVPLRAAAVAASRGSTPFGGLFLALSSFMVAAGLVLIWLLFQLLVAARHRDVGLLSAVGWTPARLAVLLVGVGAAAAVAGGLGGLLLGPAWAAVLRAGLARAWTADVATGATAVFTAPVARPLAMLLGAGVATAVSLAAVAAAAGRAARQAPLALIRGSDDTPTIRGGRWATACCAAAAVAASGLIAALARAAEPATAVAAFFASGAVALAGLLAGVRLWITAARSRPPVRSLAQLAWRGLAHRPGRPLAVAAIVALAQFLIVAVSAFALRPPADPHDRLSPTGGWTSIATFGEPTHVNPSDPATRARFGLSAAADRGISACTIALLRSSGGDDASCINLYAASRPPVIGVAADFIGRGGFRFLAHAAGDDAEIAANPWRLLERDGAAGTVPVVLDQATAQWAMRLGGVGSRFTVTGDGGTSIPCEIVGLIDGGILQGFVIVSDRNFARMFPGRSGWGMALIDEANVAADVRGATTAAFEAAWADACPTFTPAGERLRRIQAVQNTFLRGFQTLAALGLLLGTAGVAAVQAQGVFERLDAFAALRAVGFELATLHRMIVTETLATVGLGLAAGSLAGCLAVAPLLASGAGRVPLGWMAIAAGLALGAAATTGLLTAARQTIPEWPREE